MTVTRENILAALKRITDPVSGSDIVAAGVVSDLTVEGETVRFVLDVDPAKVETYMAVRDAAEVAAKAAGAASVFVVLTAHLAEGLPNSKPAIAPMPQAPQRVPGVDHIIAVASGKGGVGKSTVSANLACALAAEGRRVGLLDADVHGPSQPRMMGVSDRPTSPDGKILLPLRNYGVTMMSIGLLANDSQALLWRGSRLVGGLQQMLMDVQWGALDCLIVDLPPGTGDVSMSLAEKIELDGAILVSTPQDIALMDARRAIDMFSQMQVPVLGMIENMSVHICSSCGHEEHIFGHGSVKAEAETLGAPLLAEVPLHLDIRLASDGGAPIVVTTPDSPQAQAFLQAARHLIVMGVA
ncbi:MAG: Mrp/NBP35 family ATP-binding protein [Parvibaculaceae bacterium]|nr:Mrp/NBP35 family ATP-binding protein [Parvibaculaceae bacterium]